jgi:hypothetical protein
MSDTMNMMLSAGLGSLGASQRKATPKKKATVKKVAAKPMPPQPEFMPAFDLSKFGTPEFDLTKLATPTVDLTQYGTPKVNFRKVSNLRKKPTLPKKPTQSATQRDVDYVSRGARVQWSASADVTGYLSAANLESVRSAIERTTHNGGFAQVVAKETGSFSLMTAPTFVVEATVRGDYSHLDDVKNLFRGIASSAGIGLNPGDTITQVSAPESTALAPDDPNKKTFDVLGWIKDNLGISGATVGLVAALGVVVWVGKD